MNGPWSFAFDDRERGLNDAWYALPAHRLTGGSGPLSRQIVVPFAPETRLSGIDDRSPHGPAWYARALPAPVFDPDREDVILHFGAVDFLATVWVNGEQVASHEGGHTPFSASIGRLLRKADNVVVVRAEDPAADRMIPRGKQTWRAEPEGILYTRTTGIWQTVWLEVVSRNRISGLRMQPRLEEGCLDVEVDICGDRRGRMEFRISRPGIQLLARSVELSGELREMRLPVGQVAPWTPETPNLYDLSLTLFDSRGLVLDRIDSYFGMRSVQCRDGSFLLNGKPYFQRLILDQGYFPEGGLTAPSDDALRADIELSKAMGFNGARKHQKVEDPRWLYWADRLGFLVWGEMANAYDFAPRSLQRISMEWQATLARDFNHPCIVAWVPVNESWGFPRLERDGRQVHGLKALYHLTHALDASRPVISNDGWEHAESDLCTIHDYSDANLLARNHSSRAASLAVRPSGRPLYVDGGSAAGQPIVISEFGGIKVAGVGGQGWGYSEALSPEDFLVRYERLIAALTASPAVQGFCYTQLADVEQEVNGLLTADRRPKMPLERIREITMMVRPPMRQAA